MLVQLQYLRAIAALMVVYFHAVLQVAKLDPQYDTQMHLFGETGVDIFFILSGFVMWLTTSGREISPTDFYKRRIKRIVPLYWLATLFSAAVAVVAPSILKSTIFNIPHLLASLFFLPWRNPADPTMITPVVIPGWTLNYEMFFYLVFGVLLLVKEQWRIQALFGTMAAIILCCRIFPIETTATTAYSNPIIFEFLAGVLLGKLFRDKVLLPQRIAWIGLAVGFAFLLINERLCDASERTLMWGIPAFLIVYSAVSIDFSKLPTIGWLNYLGDASYSIYITHAFSLAFVRIACNALHLGFLQQGGVFIICCLVLSSLVGALIHELTGPDRWKRRRKAKAIVTA